MCMFERARSIAALAMISVYRQLAYRRDIILGSSFLVWQGRSRLSVGSKVGVGCLTT